MFVKIFKDGVNATGPLGWKMHYEAIRREKSVVLKVEKVPKGDQGIFVSVSFKNCKKVSVPLYYATVQ